jgi:hypothetical protein
MEIQHNFFSADPHSIADLTSEFPITFKQNLKAAPSDTKNSSDNHKQQCR